MLTLSALLDPAYDTILGRRIRKMQSDAMAKAAEPVVDNFLEMFKEFGDEKGIEEFELIICADDYKEDKPDLYELACQLEDLGLEWCANNIGIRIARKNATNLYVYFAKAGVKK